MGTLIDGKSGRGAVGNADFEEESIDTNDQTHP